MICLFVDLGFGKKNYEWIVIKIGRYDKLRLIIGKFDKLGLLNCKIGE